MFDGWDDPVAFPPAPPPPKRDPVPIVQEAGLGPRARVDKYGKYCPHQDLIPGPSSPY